MKTLIATMVSAVAIAAASASEFDADAFLGRVLKMSESTPRTELEEMVESAEENGKAIADAVVSRLKKKNVKDEDKFRLAWILGVAEQSSSVPALVEIATCANPTSMLYHAASQALARIGGDEVGAFFLKNYRQNKAKMDEEHRFDAMQTLAMVRYAPALKDAEEFLHADPARHYWQVYFIFGFFDELAVPMLCEKLNDSDEQVRVNALGAIRFLMPDSAELTKALMKRLETEKDPDIRYQLVETLEWNLLGQGEKGRQELKETFGKLLKSEAKDSAAAKFMKETVASKADVPEDMRAKFKADADKFNAAYKTILDSGVHFSRNREASQDIVYCATQSDIPKLRELRRRALYRQSDECFYDYRALTRVIQMVRTCASK